MPSVWPSLQDMTNRREDLECLPGQEATDTSLAQPGAGKAEEAAVWGLQPLEREGMTKQVWYGKL